MEPGCNVFRDIPASFWLTPELVPCIQLRDTEVEAEAKKGCSFCKFMVPCKRDTYYDYNLMAYLDFGDGKTINLHRFRGSYVEELQDGGSSSNWGYTLEYAGRTDKISGNSEHDLAKPLNQPECTESLKRIDKVPFFHDALEYNVGLMRRWFEACDRNHTNICCATLVAQDFLPTRLLDLKAFRDDIRLVHIQPNEFNGKGQLSSYLTLSHCWGPSDKHPKMTTSANLADHMDRIQLLALPKTFRDAIEITRMLGHRYLWIDSLCIIQNDEEDWAREASLMAKVYSQAYCTLAALSSSDSSQGLNLVRPDLLVDMVINDNENKKHRLQIEDLQTRPWWINEYNGSFGSSPLRYRAWAFQEKELSTRIIYFGRKQLLWECLAGKWSIRDDWPSQESTDHAKWTSTYPGQLTSNTDWYKNVWVPLVKDYSQRSLTKDTDRLLAFSGIAQTYQRLFPSAKYVAGMWSIYLPEGLLWYHESKNSRRASEFIAPSWSWASVIAPIRFYSCFNYRSRTIKVQEFWGLPKHNDAFGALIDASLVLSNAELVEFDSEIKLPVEVEYDARGAEETEENIGVLTKNGVVAGMVYLDAMDELLPITGDLMFLAIGSRRDWYDNARSVVKIESFPWGHYFVGLVLRRVHEEDIPTYRRIGLGRYVHQSLVDGVEPCRTRLI